MLPWKKYSRIRLAGSIGTDYTREIAIREQKDVMAFIGLEVCLTVDLLTCVGLLRENLLYNSSRMSFPMTIDKAASTRSPQLRALVSIADVKR